MNTEHLIMLYANTLKPAKDVKVNIGWFSRTVKLQIESVKDA